MKLLLMKRLLFFSTCLFALQAASQNVGIGTFTPKARLEVKNPLRSKLMISSEHYNDSSTLILSNRNGTEGTDFLISSNREYGLRISSESDIPGNANPLIMHMTPQGSVGVGVLPNSNASLELSSTSKGFLPNRMTTAQRIAIVSPPEGLIVFDTDMKNLYMYVASTWLPLSFGNTSYALPIEKAANDAAAGDHFGSSVAISGNYAVIGAMDDDNGGNINQGCAYVFVKTNGEWVQQAKLLASDGATGDKFGTAVAISGDYIVVGAPNATVSGFAVQGAAYVFIRSGNSWTQQSKLVAADGNGQAGFGTSVATTGSVAVVGAPYDAIFGNLEEGASYVYNRTGTAWSQVQKILLNLPADYAHFGVSIAMNPSMLVIGVPNAKNSFNYRFGSGFVYLPSGATWSYLGNTEYNGSMFGPVNVGSGQLVRVSGNEITLGGLLCPNCYPVKFYENNSGSFDPFEIPVAIPVTASSTLRAYDQAQAMAQSGDFVAVGSVQYVYLFKRIGPNWTYIRSIPDPVPTQLSNYGNQIAIDGTNMIIAKSEANGGAGKVYFMNLLD